MATPPKHLTEDEELAITPEPKQTPIDKEYGTSLTREQRRLVYQTIAENDLSLFSSLYIMNPSLLDERITNAGAFPLHCAAFMRSAHDILDWLLLHPRQNFTALSYTNKTALHYAISTFNAYAVARLIKIPGMGVDHLCNIDIPDFVDGHTSEHLFDIFRVMELLPTTVPLWDKRWVALYRQHHSGHSPDELDTQHCKPLPDGEDGNVKCLQCLEGHAVIVALPCSHPMLCLLCSEDLVGGPDGMFLCTVCRQPITAIYNKTTDQTIPVRKKAHEKVLSNDR